MSKRLYCALFEDHDDGGVKFVHFFADSVENHTDIEMKAVSVFKEELGLLEDGMIQPSWTLTGVYYVEAEEAKPLEYAEEGALTLYDKHGTPIVHIIPGFYKEESEKAPVDRLPVRSLMGLFNAVSNGESTLEYREVV